MAERNPSSYVLCPHCWTVIGIDGERNDDRPLTVCSHLSGIEVVPARVREERDEARAENANLRGAIPDPDASLDLIGALDASLVEARCEAARYREALEAMLAATERWSHFNAIATARKKARAALAKKDD